MPMSQVRSDHEGRDAHADRPILQVAPGDDRRQVLRRVRNEIARDYAYAVKNPPPDGYTLALAERGALPEAWQSDGTVPEPFTIALGEIVPRRADGTPVRLPQGDDPPDGYALALEARRSSDRKANNN